MENPLLTPARKLTLAEVVTERLRDAIFHGHFTPGQLLSEGQLAQSFGVSRGPIRDALLQLEREGLVSSRANRRTVVVELSLRDVQEVYSLRLALERLAVQNAVLNARPEDISAMEAIIVALEEAAERGITAQQAAALDIGFHDLLYRSAGHQRLLDAWSNIRSQVYVFLLSRNLANPDFRDKAIIHGHSDLLNALRERDEKRSVQCIEVHLAAAYNRIMLNYSNRKPGDDSRTLLPFGERSPRTPSPAYLDGSPIFPSPSSPAASGVHFGHSR